MQTLQEYKCPCCGGAIAFDSTLQKMKCPFCDTEFDMETLADYDTGLQEEQSSMEWETSAGGRWQEGEAEDLRSYVCKSCGGEIVGDENTAATACPFCGNPVVMTGQFSGALKPDLVIPFKLDKKAAKTGLMKHLTGKRLLPKIFRIRTILMKLRVSMFPSGCLTRTPMRRCGIAQPKYALGMTVTTIIRKRVIFLSGAVGVSVLSMCR